LNSLTCVLRTQVKMTLLLLTMEDSQRTCEFDFSTEQLLIKLYSACNPDYQSYFPLELDS